MLLHKTGCNRSTIKNCCLYRLLSNAKAVHKDQMHCDNSSGSIADSMNDQLNHWVEQNEYKTEVRPLLQNLQVPQQVSSFLK